MWRLGYSHSASIPRRRASEGEHDGGRGEADDAAAAIGVPPLATGRAQERRGDAGYSFGAMVAVAAGYEYADVSRIVAVALPLSMTEAQVPAGASKPLLLVSGDHDSYSPLAALTKLQERRKIHAARDRQDTDHFLAEAKRIVASDRSGATSLGPATRHRPSDFQIA